MLETTDGETKKHVDLAHPQGVAPGEVVVHRNHVDSPARERVQVRWERRDEGLALAGLHLSDLAVVERGAPDELHVEVAQADCAPRRLAHDRERLRQEVVQSGAPSDALPKLGGLRCELAVGERSRRAFEGVDALDHPLVAVELLLVGVAEYFEYLAEHARSLAFAPILAGASPGDRRRCAGEGRPRGAPLRDISAPFRMTGTQSRIMG